MEIETPRLILREFCDGDLDACLEYASDPATVLHMDWGPNTEEETRGFLQRMQAAAKTAPRQVFELAVTLKESGQLIGACGLRLSNPAKRSGDIGYIFNRQFWRQGYASEAARAVIDFGFQDRGLHRIWATCAPENIGSQKVLEKCGMRREGVLRGEVFSHGRWRDSVLYAILETDPR